MLSSSLVPAAEPDVVELPPPVPSTNRLQGHEGLLWLAAASVLLAAGILKGINLLIILAYCLLALWSFNWALARRAVTGIEARRLPRPSLYAGMPTEWSIEITDHNPSGGSWVLEERLDSTTASWLIVRQAINTKFRARFKQIIPQRGLHKIYPLRARSSYPLGLFTRSVDLLPEDQVIVLPRPARIDIERLQDWLSKAVIGPEDYSRQLHRVVEREGEIHGLRDYRAGDHPRRIAWKVTARRNRLTVREYEDAIASQLLLVVDAWLPELASSRDRERLESTISLAAGIVREWRRSAASRLGLVIAGNQTTAIDGVPGPGMIEPMLEALAVEPGSMEPDKKFMLEGLLPTTRQAPILLVSSRENSPLVGMLSSIPFTVLSHWQASQQEAWHHLES
jgi:uncharacterized protein (DUF58 family)